MSLHKFFKSFSCANRGILLAVKSERNMRIHTAIMIGVITISYLLHITLSDFVVVVLLFGLVLGAELFNTAIEQICNILRDRYHLPYEDSRDIRDIAAGAVWIQAIVAAIIGMLIYGKYLQ